MSPFHFIRRYAHAVGESPDASVRRLRLQLARDMLATDPDASVTRIALAVGYENVAAFGRAYRRQFGMTPSCDSRSDVAPATVTTCVVERPAIRMQALRVDRDISGHCEDGIWWAFDELVGHLDAGAVPRMGQDVFAVIAPRGGVARAAVRETTTVRDGCRLPAYEAGAGLELCLTGQTDAVWAALPQDERLHLRRDDQPLLLRYLNDPAYCLRRDQRISLFVPLAKPSRRSAK